jgi:oligopeptide transport system substrate-binding protein
LGWRVLAIILALWLETAAFAEAGQILRRPLSAEPESLDPQRSLSAESLGIGRDLFVGLTALSAEGKPVPGLATAWETSPDRKTWTFHLRHDSAWSNGEPLRAPDFVYAFRRLFAPVTGAKDPSSLAQIVGATDLLAGRLADPTKLGVFALDPYTLRIELTDPVAELPLLLTAPNAAPLNRQSIERWGEAWTQPSHMVSDGPFVLAHWVPQDEIGLARNPRFFGADDVKIDEVRWIITEDDEAALRLYRTGGLDWVPLTSRTRAWAQHAIPEQIHSTLTNKTEIIAFNLSRGILTDRRVREAISVAIDRDRWVRVMKPITEPPAYALVPDIVSDYTPQVYAWRDQPQQQRVERARALMESAGYGPDRPLDISILYTTNDRTRRGLLGVKETLRSVHVEATLQNLEWKAILTRMEARDFDLLCISETDNHDDYGSRIGDFVSIAGARNYAGYRNPAFDDLYRRAESAGDSMSRRALMQDAEKMLLDDYAVIPLAQKAIERLINPKLQGGADRIEVPQSRFLSFQP